MRLVPLAEHGDRWSYEVHAAETDPFAPRLLAYLARESLPHLSGLEGLLAKIGPLQAEQAFVFESHWRPFVS